MTTKAVILDLDGTITAFNLDVKSVRAEVRGYLIKRGVPPSLISIKESIFEMLKKTELFMNNTEKTSGTKEEIRKEAMRIAEKYELEAASQTSLLPGAIETLRSLKAMGLKIGLCTINSANSTKNIIERFKLTQYFDVVVPRNQEAVLKPNPEHCNLALKALDVLATETVVVGDSVTDMQAASEMKATAVGLPTGVSTQKQLINQGAHYVITSITDLPILIERINKANNTDA